jgi:hypothetical protein
MGEGGRSSPSILVEPDAGALRFTAPVTDYCRSAPSLPSIPDKLDTLALFHFGEDLHALNIVNAARGRRTIRQKLQSALSAWARPKTARGPDPALGYVEFAAPRQHGIQGGRGQHI